VVYTGADATLDKLPIPIHNEHDAAPFITSGNMVTRDPYTGAYNVGLYRHQVQGPQQLGVWFLGEHHGGYVYRRHEEMGRPTEVAICIGHHPAFVMGAIARVAGIGGEFAVAGGLLGEPVELVKAKTVNLLVPARAEIVIEGYMPPKERQYEGPFAEWPGHYVGESDKPFIKVTAITMRKDAIYYDVMAAAREHVILGSLPRMGSILQRVRQAVPGVRAVNVPPHSRMHCYISIKKTGDAEVKKAAFQALLTEPENLKLVIVVDDDIDVFRDTEVLWAVGTRFKAEKGLLVIPNWSGPGGLNPVGYEFHEDGSKTPVMTTAIVIDATKPAPPVPYPPRAVVPEEYVIPLDVDSILKDYVPGRAPVG
jgi:2,5-furandicarboxylate decarboxylase 1